MYLKDVGSVMASGSAKLALWREYGLDRHCPLCFSNISRAPNWWRFAPRSRQILSTDQAAARAQL
jgi:hypothetical protein